MASNLLDPTGNGLQATSDGLQTRSKGWAGMLDDESHFGAQEWTERTLAESSDTRGLKILNVLRCRVTFA